MTQPFKICPQCQEPAAMNAAFCAGCGRVYRTTAPPPIQQKQVVQPPPLYQQSYSPQGLSLQLVPLAVSPRLVSNVGKGLTITVIGIICGVLIIGLMTLGYVISNHNRWNGKIATDSKPLEVSLSYDTDHQTALVVGIKNTSNAEIDHLLIIVVGFVKTRIELFLS